MPVKKRTPGDQMFYRKDVCHLVYQELGEGCSRIMGKRLGLKDTSLTTLINLWRREQAVMKRRAAA